MSDFAELFSKIDRLPGGRAEALSSPIVSMVVNRVIDLLAGADGDRKTLSDIKDAISGLEERIISEIRAAAVEDRDAKLMSSFSAMLATIKPVPIEAPVLGRPRSKPSGWQFDVQWDVREEKVERIVARPN